ncbi:MAG: AmmeMemoRadiSam system protein A [Ectothiorhodospiraceae bacterium]|nr:AmmeMemoRadiSam system protein A [Chromatiales bacterium]MCP5157057.1 AmmeMemoRadiSam system protein A [Ectothiorhodospiraceae bacterium]
MRADRQARLLALARAALHPHALPPTLDATTPGWLTEPGASFVTLTLGGALRGCIGSIEATRALALDVHHNAIAAASRDPRFPPLDRDEVGAVRVEVSVLSALEPLAACDVDSLLGLIRPMVDGILIDDGARRATFLPQVWSVLPEPRMFLRRLGEKAGLAPGVWPASLRVWRYTVTKCVETRPGDAA